MTEITFESLGLTQEEVAERVVRHIGSLMLCRIDRDENGEDDEVPSEFELKLKERIKAQIDASIDQIAGKHVLPYITGYMEDLILQETTKWGEAKGEPVTFIEYLTQRADAFMREEVDDEGKTKEQSRGYSWNSKQTRVAHLVHTHLHYSIEKAMKAALETANSSITEGIEEAVKIKLEEVRKNLTVNVKTGR